MRSRKILHENGQRFGANAQASCGGEKCRRAAALRCGLVQWMRGDRGSVARPHLVAHRMQLRAGFGQRALKDEIYGGGRFFSDGGSVRVFSIRAGAILAGRETPAAEK